jgi:DNA invertase Pin-like site-specific DNA recombinase
VTLRAAIYARQSITREGSASLEVQLGACREAAERLRVDIVVELVEAPSTSGYRNRGRSRPKFQELLEVIRAGEVDCVIAFKTDRLSRGGGPGWAPLVDAFEAAGRDPDRTVATTDGWVSEFEIGIRSAMDREESKKTSDRMLAVRAREAREGIPRIAGRRAYGWNYDMTEHIPEETARIHEAADRVLTGESVWSICTDWNTQGVATVTGRPWTVTTVVSILTSGRIAGLREYKGVVVAKGQWERIITEEKHEALVLALAPKRTKPRKGRTYPLTSLMRCGLCGARMRSLQREGGRRTYACRKAPGLDGCGRVSIRAPELEEHVRDLICGMLADPVTRAAMARLDTDGDSDDDESDGSLMESLREIDERRQRLIDLYTDGDIDRASFRTRKDRIDDEAREIEAKIANRTSTRVLAQVPGTYEELVAAWEERGIDFQRRLIQALLHPIVVNPARTRKRAFDPGRLKIEPLA